MAKERLGGVDPRRQRWPGATAHGRAAAARAVAATGWAAAAQWHASTLALASL